MNTYIIQISPETDAEITAHVKLSGLKITNEQYVQQKVNAALIGLRTVTASTLAQKIMALPLDKQDAVAATIDQAAIDSMKN